MRNCLRSMSSVFPPSVWITLLCVALQMSLVHTWAGGHPALCLWPTGPHLPGDNPRDPSLFLRGRGSWRRPASPSWTALTLTSVSVCLCRMCFLEITSSMCRANDDWSVCIFHAFRMTYLGTSPPAAPAWLRLWWMIHPQSVLWGRKVSQESFYVPFTPQHTDSDQWV